MINKVKLIETPRHQFNYLEEFPGNTRLSNLRFKLEKGIEFTPGINIIIGENGCGKSTVLNIIRSANRVEQSFVPQLDYLPITTITELNELFEAFEVTADYSIPVYNLYRMFDDKSLVGCNGGVLDSFEKAKLFMAGKEESSGQNVMGDINQLLNWMFNRQEESKSVAAYIDELHKTGRFSGNSQDSNDTTDELLKNIQKNSVKSDPKVFTVLMDEPDQGLDISNLEEVYSMISYDKPQTQLIAVVHNPVLIYRLSKLDYVNIIEMSKDYLKKVRSFIEG